MGFFKDLVELRQLTKERQRETKGKEKTISITELAKVYKTFGPYFIKYWKILALAYSSLFVTIAVGLLKPWPLKLILDHLVLKEPFPEQVSFLIPYYESDPKFLLLLLALAVLVIAVVSALFSYFNSYWMSRTGFLLNADIREHVFAHLQKLSLSFHDRSQSGNLLYILTNDFKVVKALLIQFPQSLVERTVTLVAYLVIMLMMDWRLALIGFSTMPLIYFATKFFGSGVKVATHKMRRRLGEISTILLENVSSMAVIQAYGREKDEWERFREGNEESLQAQLLSMRLQRAYGWISDFLITLSTAGLLYIGGHYALGGEILPGTLIVLVAYMRDLYGTFQKFNGMYIGLARGLVNVERLMEVIDNDMEVKDAPDAVQAPAFQGRVAFEEVTFAYKKGRDVLKKLNFTAEPGETVALVGHSGAGKSTIISLLLRFYDSQQGQILIDGQDIRKYTMKSMRDQITIVLQEAKLFRQTVRENIAFGKLGATDDEVVAAAKQAEAHDFIIDMAEGYDTLMYEGGENLSGGEKQRINLARAIIRNTPIVILDEPITGLDARAEAKINEAIQRLTKGRTTFIIAHKLSTITSADKILLLEEGQLAHIGTHEQLMQESPQYGELYKLQFGWKKEFAEGEKDGANGQIQPSTETDTTLVG